MTLIVAHRKNGLVTLSSDSRITFGDNGHFDFGIKIFSVELNLRNGWAMHGIGLPYIHPDLPKKERYLLGLAVAGSSVLAYTVKESISSMLNTLFPTGPHSDLSLEAIGEIICKVYEFSSKELMLLMREQAQSEFVIVGFCHIKRQFKAFHFFINKEDIKDIKFCYKEILTTDGTECFGSGKKYAEDILKINPTIKPLRLVKAVIDSKQDKKVGGGLQHGAFGLFTQRNEDFGIVGVHDNEHTPNINNENYYTLSPVYRSASPLDINSSKYPWLKSGMTYVGLDHE
jgi:hypothetical protein